MAEDSDLEKTEQASPKRLEKAREDGDVPRSRELATVSVLLAAGLGLLMMGTHLNDAAKKVVRDGLHFERAEVFDPTLLLMKITHMLADLMITFAPFALLLVVVALASPALIGGWIFSSKALTPKFSRLNPLTGISHLVSKNAGVELVKSIAKASLVGFVAFLVVSHEMTPILTLSNLTIQDSLASTGHLMQTGFLAIVGALVLIAGIDVPFQLYQYAHKLKMTREEVRQEMKESEGNPEIKARVRQQQREMAKRRMMADIPKADVVITNPTHYAVAIQYKENNMRAPIVVAKGADAIALKIREIAAQHHITTLESPKLARALYAHADINSEIPEALYAAVAEILAYVFQMRIFKQQGGHQPNLPGALPVPEALDPHSLIPAASTAETDEFAS